MRAVYYRVDEYGDAVPTDAFEGTRQLASADSRCAAVTRMPDGFVLSTAFLVMDHNWIGGGPRVLWDTRLLGPNGECRILAKYATLAEAEVGHRQCLALLQLVGASNWDAD
jgi:hypothetical protein